MTNKQIAARLREMAGREPTYITHELLRLAHELEQTPEPGGDIEALVRATQPPNRRGNGLVLNLFGRRR